MTELPQDIINKRTRKECAACGRYDCEIPGCTGEPPIYPIYLEHTMSKHETIVQWLKIILALVFLGGAFWFGIEVLELLEEIKLNTA